MLQVIIFIMALRVRVALLSVKVVIIFQVCLFYTSVEGHGHLKIPKLEGIITYSGGELEGGECRLPPPKHISTPQSFMPYSGSGGGGGGGGGGWLARLN